MEAIAKSRWVGTSPRKMRMVIDLIRGKSVDSAIEILHFQPKHAARSAEKTLRSAVANLFQKDDSVKHDASSLFIKEAFVDEGPSIKRMLPAPQGRAYRIRKRSHHLTIKVAVKS